MDEFPPISEMPPPAMSLPARLMNVFAEPSEVFDCIKTTPPRAANWLLPAFTFILAGWLGTWAIFSQDSIKNQVSEITEKGIEKRIEQGKLSRQDAEKSQQAGSRIIIIGWAVSTAVSHVFVAFGTPFWGGLIVWLVGNKALKGSFPYMKAVEVAGMASMIAVLGEIVRVLLVVMLGNLFASPSLALLMKDVDPQSPTFGVLAVFNLFLFWELGVRSVGLARLSGVSFGKAAAWVFGIWAGFTGLVMGIGQGLRVAFGG